MKHWNYVFKVNFTLHVNLKCRLPFRVMFDKLVESGQFYIYNLKSNKLPTCAPVVAPHWKNKVNKIQE